MPTPPPRTVRKLTFNGQDTRKNLPNSTKRGETNFLAKFERAFFAAEVAKQGERKLAAGREFTVDGYGRADVLFLAWKETPDAEDFRALALKSLRITAFEAKMKDWRKGLSQASRYKHFANRSILVLPPETASTALNFLQTFRDLNVGLWEFDPTTDRIIRHCTPMIRKPRNKAAWEKAMHQLRQKLNLR